MKIKFWKLSQGFGLFTFDELLKSIEDRLIYIHKDTGAKGNSKTSQGEDFINASIGDYFYLTHGNSGGIYLLGQMTGPVNYFSNYPEGWVDRPFRIIARAKNQEFYKDQEKWWTPNHNSTFVEVPKNELKLFQDLILKPYFDIDFKNFGLKV